MRKPLTFLQSPSGLELFAINVAHRFIIPVTALSKAVFDENALSRIFIMPVL